MKTRRRRLEKLIAEYKATLKRESSYKAMQHSIAEDSRAWKVEDALWRIKGYEEELEKLGI